MRKSFKQFVAESQEYGSYFRKLKEDGQVITKKSLSALDPNRMLLKYRDIQIDLKWHFIEQRARYKDRNFLTDDQICEIIVKFIDKLYEIRIVDALDTPLENIEESTFLVYSKIMHSAIMLSKYKGVTRTYNLFNIFPQRSKNEKYHKISLDDKEIIIEGLAPGVSNDFAEYMQYLNIGRIDIVTEEKIYCDLSKGVIFEDGTKLTLMFDSGKLWDIKEVGFFEVD